MIILFFRQRHRRVFI
ncbi:hypothetical protein D049_1127A, partial [Vibrio parahaemolyticus VPTS-2010]